MSPSRRAFLAVRDEIRRRIEATFGEDVSPDYP